MHFVKLWSIYVKFVELTKCKWLAMYLVPRLVTYSQLSSALITTPASWYRLQTLFPGYSGHSRPALDRGVVGGPALRAEAARALVWPCRHRYLCRHRRRREGGRQSKIGWHGEQGELVEVAVCRQHAQHGAVLDDCYCTEEAATPISQRAVSH